ncbi:MAG: reprolysin-like metallopeptidase [Saprospiraceae bacterium]
MQNLTRLSFLLSLLLLPLFGMAQDSRTVDLDVPSIKDWLANAPNENSAAAANTAIVIDLPLVNGENISVKVLESPMLSNSKSGIRTYSFIGFEDPSYSGRLMVSDRGIDAHMFTPDGRFLIQPVTLGAAAHQISFMTGEYPHLANDAQRPDGYVHQHQGEETAHQHEAAGRNIASTPYAIGAQLRKFRMHVIADKEYSTAATSKANPTRADVFAAITAAVNSMNAFYVKEMSVMLTLDESIQTIYLTENPAGFSTGSPQWHVESLVHHKALETTNNNPPDDNATVVPRNSYDVGHLFSGRVASGSGGGGVAFVGVVCANTEQSGGPLKAGGGSGVPDPKGSGWIDLLSHEFTHQFSADHTWSANSGACTPDQFSAGGVSAYEPGGGSTIVSYADICGVDNIPNRGNTSYYHTNSIKQVDDYIKSSSVTCETTEASGNQVPAPNGAVSGCTPNYTIPIRTPFYIKGSATDGNDPASQLTYTWEQYNNASSQFDPIDGPTMKNGNNLFPIIRSFAPTNDAGRTIPQTSTILSGNYNGDTQNAATLTQTNWQGELLPEVTGNITMRMTVRDNNATAGGVEFADVDITVAGSVPFSVTAPNTATSVTAGNDMTITWERAGTHTGLFNHTNVTIKLSVDGGMTFPITLANVANSGSADVTIPTGVFATTTARIRVEAGTECFYFFDINNANFTINNPPCQNNSTTFSGSGDVTADAGDNSLNLSLSPQYGSTINNFTGTISNTDPTSNLPFLNNTPAVCAVVGNVVNYDVFTFYTDTEASHTFSLNGDFGLLMNLYEGAFNTINLCSGHIGSSATRPSGSGNISLDNSSGGMTISASLKTNTLYTLVVSNFTATFPTPPNSYTVTVTGGSLADGKLAPTNYTFTYVAINSSGIISKIDAGADFTTLSGGGEMYTVSGYSVLNADLTKFNALEGQSSTNLSNGAYCAGVSSNSIKLTVTGEDDPCANTSEKTITAADIASASVDTISNGGAITTSGTVAVASGRSLALLSNTAITLAPGFDAQAGSGFLAKIGCAKPASAQEEEPVMTVYRYSPETEEVVAIETKPTIATAATTALGTPSLSKLDLNIAPNPARDFTNLTFSLSKPSQVNMTIYDMSGRAVESMIQGQAMSAGWHQVQYTPQSIKGGMYYVVLQADKEVVTKKMILVR